LRIELPASLRSEIAPIERRAIDRSLRLPDEKRRRRLSSEDFAQGVCGGIKSVIRGPTELDQANALREEMFDLVVAISSAHEDLMVDETDQ